MVRRKDAFSEEVTDPVTVESAAPPVDGDAATVVPPPPLPVDETAELRESNAAADPAPVRPARGLGILGPLLGGVLAAAGGFALSHFDLLDLSPPQDTTVVQALSDRVAALEGKPDPGADLTALSDRIAALETAPGPAAPDLSAIEERLAAIEALSEGGDASTAALAAKLAELERRLAAQPQALDQTEVDAALARLETAEAEAKSRADEAAAQAEAAAKAVALDRLRSAVTSGAPFEAELAALGDDKLQAALAPHVAGVVTLESLQTDFPDAARQALQLDRAASDGDGWGSRFVDFLAAQTGARSVTPREGEDADAILSRAEFALGEGQLADAVTELRTLDPALQPPFADWLARADARLAALAALEGK